mgnify:CR=1 FL=1
MGTFLILLRKRLIVHYLGKLAYSPIGFSEYHPVIVAEDLAKHQSNISPKIGYFDNYKFEDLCIAVSDIENVQLDDTNLQKENFVNVQRAIDPFLRKRWNAKYCPKNNNKTCLLSQAESK